MHDYLNDKRFDGLKPLEKKALLSSPTMHGIELEYMKKAYDSGWMTTVGENINELEEKAADHIGMPYAVALTCGTAALHLAVKLAAEKFYQSSTGISTPFGKGAGGSLFGKRVFCTDLTFDATVNPIVYEGGEPVFIDSEYETWNMDPEALRTAFKMYPEVKLVVLVHLYGNPAKTDEIKKICEENGALLIEDAAESLGASIGGKQTGAFGDYGVISFNGNKIITGSSGGILFTHDEYSANKARKWSTQSREAAPWYEHEELGYNYRISNVIAGVVRGQWDYLEEHISQKKAIYERYKVGLGDLPLSLNPMSETGNYWLSCALIDRAAMCHTARSGRNAVYEEEKGKSCPTEILEALSAFGCEGRPVWKPMHMQPIYSSNAFVTKHGNGRAGSNAYINNNEAGAVSADLFRRGLCLPSDNKMTADQQETVVEILHRCFE